MAAKFYSGASISATKDVTPTGRSSPRTNTMKGMPGFIKVAGTTSAAGLKGAGHTGPKREGPIGHKGGPHRANQQHGTGTTQSYRASATGPAGRVSAGKMESLIGRARTSWEK